MSMGVKAYAQKCPDVHAPTSFYGAMRGLHKCQLNGAPLGGSQYQATEMLIEGRSPQLITGGHRQLAEMPLYLRPHQFTGCQIVHAEMLLKVRTQGKGQVNVAEMPTLLHPSRSITGGQIYHAEMPRCLRPPPNLGQ